MGIGGVFDSVRENLRAVSFAVVVVLAVFTIVFSYAMLYRLRVGEVAVIVNPITGSISEPVTGPKWGVKAPWEHLIKDFYTVDYIEMSSKQTADYPPITALTRDGVEVAVEMTFTYEVDPHKFKSLVENYPRIDYEEQRLVPILRQTARDVISKYTVDEIITQRDKIAKEIEEVYRNRIRNDPTLAAIILHEVNLRDIRLPRIVEEAIQDKTAAYQRKIAAQYDAERMITLAQGEKTAKILKAEGEANATLILANAQKEALQLILAITNDTDVAKIWMLRSLPKGTPVIVIIGNGAPTPFLLDITDYAHTTPPATIKPANETTTTTQNT